MGHLSKGAGCYGGWGDGRWRCGNGEIRGAASAGHRRWSMGLRRRRGCVEPSCLSCRIAFFFLPHSFPPLSSIFFLVSPACAPADAICLRPSIARTPDTHNRGDGARFHDAKRARPPHNSLIDSLMTAPFVRWHSPPLCRRDDERPGVPASKHGVRLAATPD